MILACDCRNVKGHADKKVHYHNIKGSRKIRDEIFQGYIDANMTPKEISLLPEHWETKAVFSRGAPGPVRALATSAAGSPQAIVPIRNLVGATAAQELFPEEPAAVPVDPVVIPTNFAPSWQREAFKKMGRLGGSYAVAFVYRNDKFFYDIFSGKIPNAKHDEFYLRGLGKENRRQSLVDNAPYTTCVPPLIYQFLYETIVDIFRVKNRAAKIRLSKYVMGVLLPEAILMLVEDILDIDRAGALFFTEIDMVDLNLDWDEMWETDSDLM